MNVRIQDGFRGIPAASVRGSRRVNHVRPAAVLAMLLLAWGLWGCKKETVVSETSLQFKMRSRHFDYYQALADTVKIDTAWQEKYYQWLISKLKVQPTVRLVFYKYIDREHLRKITGKETNGFAEIANNSFHTIWKVDNHECVHAIVTAYVGNPPALFNEGVAVAHQAGYNQYLTFVPGWNGKNFDTISQTFKKANRLPPVDSLLTSRDFWKHDADVVYPVSGSFVNYLIDAYGIEKVKSFIARTNYNDDKAKTSANFSLVFKAPAEEIWNAWLHYLEK